MAEGTTQARRWSLGGGEQDYTFQHRADWTRWAMAVVGHPGGRVMLVGWDLYKQGGGLLLDHGRV